jgi:uncharacterized protein involved in exopolysaccharide biosynthesis
MNGLNGSNGNLSEWPSGSQPPHPTIEFAPLATSWQDSQGSPEGLHSLSGLWAALQRRKLIFLAALVLVALVFTIFILLLPAKYLAEARLFVTRSRVDSPMTTDRTASSPVRADVTEEEVASEMELLKSRELLAQIVDAGLAGPIAPTQPDWPSLRERLLRQLEKDLRVAPVRKTTIISVQYAAKDPAQAANVVNKMSDLYLEKHMAIHRNRETSEFFTKQAAYYQTELTQAEKDLQDFEQHHQSSLLEMQKESALKRGNDVEAAVEDTNSQIRDAQDRARELMKQLNTLTPTVNSQNRSARNEPLIDHLKSLLVELGNKRTELLGKYEPGYRLVQEIDRQIRDTNAALDREMNPQVVDRVDTLNPVRQSIEAELLRTESVIAGLKARQQAVTGDHRRYRSKEQSLGRLTAQNEDLHRRVKIAEENYLLYQKRQEEARIAEALDRQKFLNVSVVERGVPPALPADRHRSLIALLGLLIAALVAIAAALTVDHLDRPVQFAPQLSEVTGLPVLASVSRSGD